MRSCWAYFTGRSYPWCLDLGKIVEEVLTGTYRPGDLYLPGQEPIYECSVGWGGRDCVGFGLVCSCSIKVRMRKVA